MAEDINEELQSLIERFEGAPDSRLFAPLADAYRKKGDIDRAIEICERGIERYPEYASARVILGKCFYDKGATERAKSEFVRVLELDSENMVALKFVGEILLAEDDRREAATYFRKLLSIDPLNEDAKRILKELESEFQVREIDLEDSKTVTQIDRPQELATMTLAGIYAAQGYYNKALKIYQQILEREPENREAKEMVGKLEHVLGTSETDLGDAFEGEVLTVPLEDVGLEMRRSTAGPGGERFEEKAPDIGKGGEEDTGGREPVDDHELTSVVDELEMEEEQAGTEQTEPARVSAGSGMRLPWEEVKEGREEVDTDKDQDMQSFRTWIRKLQDKNGNT
ncbi:MAG: tetratricopeptide repeat protein [bacterium]|nr:MAG: tetratricopeptide repeat protein [bacterium]